jgi:hypothetical protein
MALQRETASNRVLGGQDHWRLFQQIESSGDIWEIDESLKGVAIGPESDVSEVFLSYYDSAQPNSIQKLSVAVGNPFEGRLDALMGTPYPSTGSNGRILVSLGDLIDNAYEPLNWDPGDPPITPADPIIYVPSFVDLFGYFDKKAEQARVRSNRKILFSVAASLPVNASAVWYVVPCYGRRYGSVLVVNHDPSTEPVLSISVDLIGVRLAVGKTVAGTNKAGEVPIGSAAGITQGNTGHIIWRSSRDGLFDLLVLKFVPSIQGLLTYDVNIRFDLSDSEEG